MPILQNPTAPQPSPAGGDNNANESPAGTAHPQTCAKCLKRVLSPSATQAKRGDPAKSLAEIPSVTLPAFLRPAIRNTVWHLLDDGLPKTVADQLLVGRLVAKVLTATSPDLEASLAGLRQIGGPPALIVHGLPVDNATTDTSIGDLVSLGLAQQLGVPFQYTPQPDASRLVARLTVKPGQERIANTGQGGGDFKPHSDFTIFAPDTSPYWLILLGIRNEAGAWTSYTPIDPIIERLSPTALRTLQEPRFLVKAPSNVSTRTTLLSRPRPVLWQEVGVWHVGLPTYWVQPADPQDYAAREALAEILPLTELPELTHRLVIDRGTALIFANHRGLHARGPVNGSRLVLRTYVARDTEAVRQLVNPSQLIDVRQLI